MGSLCPRPLTRPETLLLLGLRLLLHDRFRTRLERDAHSLPHHVERIRLAGELDRAKNEITLLREEAWIKDARIS